MNNPWKPIIWHQFGAAIDMLDNALRACPDELWRERLWINPFTLIEQDDDGPQLERPYTKDELQTYLAYARQKYQARLEGGALRARQRR